MYWAICTDRCPRILVTIRVDNWFNVEIIRINQKCYIVINSVVIDQLQFIIWQSVCFSNFWTHRRLASFKHPYYEKNNKTVDYALRFLHLDWALAFSVKKIYYFETKKCSAVLTRPKVFCCRCVHIKLKLIRSFFPYRLFHLEQKQNQSDWLKFACYVDPVHLFLSLSSETEFEFRKLSFAIGHYPSPFRQWPWTQKQFLNSNSKTGK